MEIYCKDLNNQSVILMFQFFQQRYHDFLYLQEDQYRHHCLLYLFHDLILIPFHKKQSIHHNLKFLKLKLSQGLEKHVKLYFPDICGHSYSFI